ncbi:MAG: hypothetical protein H7Y20_00200 [Bryobacteraceae bacterium]|nr:hypothetical protein [Bryobacteraceae bacterium]
MGLMDSEHNMLLGLGLLGFVGAFFGKDFRAGSFGGFPISRTVGRVGMFVAGLILVFAAFYMP